MKKNFYFILLSALTLLCTSCENTTSFNPARDGYYIKYTSSDWYKIPAYYDEFEYDSDDIGPYVIVSNDCEGGNGVIIFSAKVIGIGEIAFQHRKNLTSIYLPGTITSIGNQAFEGCSNLKSVYIHSIIPPTLVRDSYDDLYVFYECPEDLKIYIPAESENAYMNSPDWEPYKDRLVPTNY